MGNAPNARPDGVQSDAEMTGRREFAAECGLGLIRDAGQPTERELAAGLRDKSVTLTEYLIKLASSYRTEEPGNV